MTPNNNSAEYDNSLVFKYLFIGNLIYKLVGVLETVLILRWLYIQEC